MYQAISLVFLFLLQDLNPISCSIIDYSDESSSITIDVASQKRTNLRMVKTRNLVANENLNKPLQRKENNNVEHHVKSDEGNIKKTEEKDEDTTKVQSSSAKNDDKDAKKNEGENNENKVDKILQQETGSNESKNKNAHDDDKDEKKNEGEDEENKGDKLLEQESTFIKDKIENANDNDKNAMKNEGENEENKGDKALKQEIISNESNNKNANDNDKDAKKNEGENEENKENKVLQQENSSNQNKNKNANDNDKDAKKNEGENEENKVDKLLQQNNTSNENKNNIAHDDDKDAKKNGGAKEENKGDTTFIKNKHENANDENKVNKEENNENDKNKALNQTMIDNNKNNNHEGKNVQDENGPPMSLDKGNNGHDDNEKKQHGGNMKLIAAVVNGKNDQNKEDDSRNESKEQEMSSDSKQQPHKSSGSEPPKTDSKNNSNDPDVVKDDASAAIDTPNDNEFDNNSNFPSMTPYAVNDNLNTPAKFDNKGDDNKQNTMASTDEKIYILPTKKGDDAHYETFLFLCDGDEEEYYLCGQDTGVTSQNFCEMDGAKHQPTFIKGGDNKLCFDLLTREEHSPRVLFELPICPNGKSVKSYSRYSSDGYQSQWCDLDGCVPCSTDYKHHAVHFNTLDYLTSFEYTGQCDLVAASTSTKYDGLDVHVRTRIVPTAPPPGVTLINRIGIKLGDDVVEVTHDGKMYLNNVLMYDEIRKSPGDGLLDDIQLGGKYSFMKSSSKIVGRGEIVKFTLDLDDDEKLAIILHERKMDILFHNVTLTDGVGMLVNSNFPNSFTGRDGKTEIIDVNDFIADWQVRPNVDAEIFQISHDPVYPTKCILPEDTKALQDKKKRRQ